jgi:hypothetical protein
MKRLRIRVEPGDVIVEMLSIVVAILLALAVNNWQEHVRQERALHESVASIVREMAYNQRVLAAAARQHEREANAIKALVTADFGRNERISFDAFYKLFAHIAPNGLGGLELQSVAWQVAQGDPSFGAMPAGQRLRLAQIYERQAFLARVYADLVAHVTSVDETNGFPQLVDMDLEFGDVRAAERTLLASYAVAIPQLRTAYGLPATP